MVISIGSTVVSVIVTIVVSVVAARLQSREALLYDAKRKRKEKRLAAHHAERSASEKRKDKHWVAAAQLLRNSLFRESPQEFRVPLIDKILERIENRTGLNGNLVRAIRFFIEARLLYAAVGYGPAIPLEGSVNADFEKLAPTFEEALSGLDEQRRAVELGTCFQLGALEHAEPTASSYFRALIELRKTYPGYAGGELPDVDRFLTRISVNDGFVSPSYLVGGVLRHFELNSQQALSKFNEALLPAATPSMLLQRFEFFCWVLWSASIPVCQCSRWQGDFRVVQYGFGDESNSFPLIIDEQVYARAWGDIKRRHAIETDKPLPLANASAITGTIVWGPQYHLAPRDFPNIHHVPATEEHADRDLRHHSRPGPRRRAFDGLMLRADEIQWLHAARRYYSACAWVMFEVYRADGLPLYASAQERWRALLPVFEHANFADGDTLLFFKRLLAEKAATTVEQFERDANGLRVRYLCAFDDPGEVANSEGYHRFYFTMDSGPQRNTETAADVGQNRLRSLLVRALSEGDLRTRLFCSTPRVADVIASCDLPDILEDFYRHFLQAPVPR
jgi:hypothetical protein